MIRAWFLLLPLCCFFPNADAVETRVSIATQVELSWPTTLGKNYQVQSSSSAGGGWIQLGSTTAGDGVFHSLVDPLPFGQRFYQVLETTPATASSIAGPVNGGFETASGSVAANWVVSGTQPPTRTDMAAHSGSFSMRSALLNVGSTPAEGGIYQKIAAQGGNITAGQSYNFSFWAKQVSTSLSYIQQYQLQWLNSADSVLGGGTGLANFNGTQGAWIKFSNSNLVPPVGAVDAKVMFRFVTGAVAGGLGEVLIDDVALDGGNSSSGTPEVIRALPVTTQRIAAISWPSISGTLYQPMATTDFVTWNEIATLITGDGSTKVITVPMNKSKEYFRLRIPAAVILPPSNLQIIPTGIANAIGLSWAASATTGVTGYRVVYGLSSSTMNQSINVGITNTATLTGLLAGQTYFLSVIAITSSGESTLSGATISTQPDAANEIVALFNTTTSLEAETTVNTSTALITRVGDRARDRHAREAIYNSYDHYLSWYWEERTIGLEIIDRVAKGGTGITFNYKTLTPLSAPEFRAFFRGIGTVAEYHFNLLAPLIAPNLYSATVTTKPPENRALQIGDRIEIEISQFIQAPMNGRNNYYGTAMLYVVGQGIVPWEAVGSLQDSQALPELAWLGGKTTLPYQYSNEPEDRFKQTAGNIAPDSIQPFMRGRRLHHTDFSSGVHSEPGNPIFTEQIGKLGSKFISRSCVECHVNNGRALPPSIGAPMLQSVVKVGSDASGSTHPTLGAVLQPKVISGTAEGAAVIASYTTTSGQYNDGTSYSLRKPNYTFGGTTPLYFSVRLTPPLVGLGLLEAVAESTIVALADPNDANQNGISGRVQKITDPENAQMRMGRFTAKGGKARVKHQIASALNTDMGVTTAIFPVFDGETTVRAAELSSVELDEMTRYVALLGVGARRDLTDSQALQGQQLFNSASCSQCHVPTLVTSSYHPMTELRNQTIRPYTDLLLHDMGSGLADNMGEGIASGSEWRTPPLWSIGLTAGVSGGEAYLHDGRARTIEEAILWHGGEAESAKQSFLGMSSADRAALVRFIKSL